MVGVLKGAVLFIADLMRELTVPCEIDFMAVSSYGSETDSSGVVRIMKDLDAPIEDREVLIVEDIIDSGLTLHYLMKNLRPGTRARSRSARSLPSPSAGGWTCRSSTSDSRSRTGSPSGTGSTTRSACATFRTWPR